MARILGSSYIVLFLLLMITFALPGAEPTSWHSYHPLCFSFFSVASMISLDFEFDFHIQ